MGQKVENRGANVNFHDLMSNDKKKKLILREKNLCMENSRCEKQGEREEKRRRKKNLKQFR